MILSSWWKYHGTSILDRKLTNWQQNKSLSGLRMYKVKHYILKCQCKWGYYKFIFLGFVPSVCSFVWFFFLIMKIICIQHFPPALQRIDCFTWHPIVLWGACNRSIFWICFLIFFFPFLPLKCCFRNTELVVIPFLNNSKFSSAVR